MTVTAVADTKIALDRGRPVSNHSTGPAPTLDDPPVRDADDLRALTQAAIAGDQKAWANLYVRYTPLISTVCRQYRLRPSDADDVGQVVWLRLIQHLKGLREPRALPGWIATTTRNEAVRVLRMHQRTEPADPSKDGRFDQIHSSGFDDHLLIAEQRQVLHNGINNLRPEHRKLLLLLLSEPEVPYQEISRRLGIPVGSIGPTRARCLDKIRSMSTHHR
jgi:RNA polymerase sigma factor (sigma-70 family)